MSNFGDNAYLADCDSCVHKPDVEAIPSFKGKCPIEQLVIRAVDQANWNKRKRGAMVMLAETVVDFENGTCRMWEGVQDDEDKYASRDWSLREMYEEGLGELEW